MTDSHLSKWTCNPMTCVTVRGRGLANSCKFKLRLGNKTFSIWSKKKKMMKSESLFECAFKYKTYLLHGKSVVNDEGVFRLNTKLIFTSRYSRFFHLCRHVVALTCELAQIHIHSALCWLGIHSRCLWKLLRLQSEHTFRTKPKILIYLPPKTQISELHLHVAPSVPLHDKNELFLGWVWWKHFHSSAFSVQHASVRRVLMPSVSMTGLQSSSRIQQLGGFCSVPLTCRETQKPEQSLSWWPETILLKPHFVF